MEKENQLQVFSNEEFGQVRIIIKDGKEYFAGSDIAKALGYAIPSKAINTHCKGVSKMEVPTKGGIQEMLFIPEGDIYRLIIKSNLPQAGKFEKWVFEEVLPSIRKHGAYMTDDTIEKALLNPDFLIKLATELKDEKLKRIEAEKKIEENKPLVTFAETCIKSKDNILIRQLSKIANDEGIDIGEKRLYKKLRGWNLIMKNSVYLNNVISLY